MSLFSEFFITHSYHGPVVAPAPALPAIIGAHPTLSAPSASTAAGYWWLQFNCIATLPLLKSSWDSVEAVARESDGVQSSFAISTIKSSASTYGWSVIFTFPSLSYTNPSAPAWQAKSRKEQTASEPLPKTVVPYISSVFISFASALYSSQVFGTLSSGIRSFL